MFWNREEVFMSYEFEKYVKAKEILEDNQIAFKTSVNPTNMNRNTHAYGNYGMEQKYNKTYYIYTDKSVAKRARYLIRKELFNT